MIVKVKTGPGVEWFLVGIERLLPYHTKIIHSVIEYFSVFDLHLKDTVHGVLVLLDTLAVDRLTKGVSTIDQESILVSYTIHFPIKLKKELEQGRLHCFGFVKDGKISFHFSSFNGIDINEAWKLFVQHYSHISSSLDDSSKGGTPLCVKVTPLV